VSLLPASCKSWQDIASLTQLQALVLRRCTITASGKRSLSSSTSSSSSDSASALSSGSFSGGSCAASGGSLCVSSCEEQRTKATAVQPLAVSDARCLAALQQLTALDCSGSSVDAAAITTLQQLPALQHVCLTRCQGVNNAVLGALAGCSRLSKLDLRLRGSGCSWGLKGLLPLLQQLPGLSAVYLSEVHSKLPKSEESRVIVCSTEQAPLPVARDVGLRM
jgi:hypothetical protein